MKIDKTFKVKKNPKPFHRPKVIIDWKIADRLLEAGSQGSEVAAYFGIHPDTFYKRVEIEKGVCLSVYMQEKRSKGKSLLREEQHKVALKGNPTMLIWLGKQRLDQREPEPLIKQPENQIPFNAWLDFQKDKNED